MVTVSAPETTSWRSVWLGWTWLCAGKPRGRPITSYSSSPPPVSAAVRRNSSLMPRVGASRVSPCFTTSAKR